MKLRRGLFIYCIVAVVMLLLAGAWVISAAARVGAQAAELEPEVVQLRETAERERVELTALEETQRIRRSTATGLEAIELSAKVQLQQQEVAAAEAALAEREKNYTGFRELYQQRMSRLVPVIALLLLHALGIFMFWPKRDGGKETRRATRQR